MVLDVEERRGGADGRRRKAVDLAPVVSCAKNLNKWLRRCAWTGRNEREQLGVLGRSRSTGNVRKGGGFGELR